MQDSSYFELPNPSEKLAHKFILDSVKDRHQQEEIEITTVPPAEAPPSQELVLSAEPPLEEVLPDELLTDEEGEASAPVAVPLPELILEAGRKYFRIGEVSELIGVEPYVLRYWESEFSGVRPVKSGSGHRVYSRKDVQTLHLIRHLLHVEKFSIKGAKLKLQDRKQREVESPLEGERKQNRELLKGLAQGLRDLIQFARGNPGTF